MRHVLRRGPGGEEWRRYGKQDEFMRETDAVVVGAGVVGLATGRALVQRGCRRVVVLEAEERIAAHQSGNNSGVIHSGLYYRPGSLKARNCVEGRRALYAYCEEKGIACERCGKLVVATEERDLAGLDDLERRGRGNGLEGMRRLRGEELSEYEPHVRGIAGLWIAETGIVDFRAVAEAYAADIREGGGEVLTGAELLGVRRDGDGLVLETRRGELRSGFLVNCAGLQSDRVARLCGIRAGVKIVPFRGEYYELKDSRRGYVRNLIYPVPDPRFPFLGVHLTRLIDGRREAGPNAVLAFKREGYTRWSFSMKDMLETLMFPGFWMMGVRHWRMGVAEFRRSFFKSAFVASVRRLVPDLEGGDFVRGGAGVRAQALDRAGNLLDDFRIEEGERMIHVLNAPSPAATASLSIGAGIADRVVRRMGLEVR